MKKTKKDKKEVAKTPNVDVELTENELEAVAGGIDIEKDFKKLLDPKTCQ